MLPIYIISLKQDVKKRELIAQKLDALNISFNFIDAVYGKNLSEEFVESLNSVGKIKDRGFNPILGEIGCTLSHLLAFKLIEERREKWACILEDDVIIDERFKYFIDNFNSNLFKQDNLYLLGGLDGLNSSRFISYSFISKVKVSDGISFRKTIDSYPHIFRTCCYLASFELANSLLKLSKDEFFLADDWAYFHKKEVFKDIYISDFVKHPLDLSVSHIEKERKEKNNQNNFREFNQNIVYKIKVKVLTAIRLTYTFLKRFRG